MTIDELKAADAVLLETITILTAKIGDLDNDPPTDNTSDEWGDLWYESRNRIEMDFHDAIQRRLDLVRIFSACAVIGKQAAKGGDKL